MMAKSKKKILLLLLSCAFALCCLLGLGYGKRSVSASAEFDAIELPTKGLVGEEIVLPEVAVEIGGESFTAKTCVVYPDGCGYEVSRFTPDEAGAYTVEFYVVKDGRKYAQTQTVRVQKDAFSVSADKSELYYGTHATYTDLNGLVVGLANGETLDYNKTIDFTQKTENDTLVSFSLAPTQLGAADAENLYVTFADAYNPSNQFKVYIWKNSGGAVYTRIFVNGDSNSYGLEKTKSTSSATRTILVDYYKGNNYYLWKNSWGAMLQYRFSGIMNDKQITDGETKLIISMDYETKQVFIKVKESATLALIADLDDERIFPNGFTGFSSGLAYMSVSTSEQSAARFGMVIDKIDGKEIYAEEATAEVPAPVIEIDYPKAYESVPHALVGKTYPVFDAEARVTSNNQAKLDVSVFYGYHNGGRVELPIKDGRFATPYAGTYTIRYTATDYYGQTTETLVDVPCINAAPLKAEFAEEATTWITGKAVTVPAPIITDSYGQADIQIKKEAILKSDESVRYAIDGEQFLPMQAGTYKIVYECTNIAETITAEKEIVVANSQAPVFLDTPLLPKYLLKNAKYVFPQMQGTVFGEVNCEIDAQISVKGNGEATATALADGQAYQVGDYSSVEVIYTAANGAHLETYSRTIPVLDVGYGTANLSISSYFQKLGGEYTVQAEKSKMAFAANANSYVHTEFIRELIADGFYAKFGNITDGGTVHIYLTDMKNADERVKLTYQNTEGSTKFYINDEYVVKFTEALTSKTVEFNYDGAFGSIAPDGTVAYEIATYENGAKFNGFSSGYVYLELATESVTSAVSFDLVSVWGQGINSVKYDIVRPYYEDSGDKGRQSLNAEYVLKTTKFADVLDPFVTVSVSVLTPDNTYAVAADGTVLKNLTSLDKDYVIRLSSYGQYLVQFTLSDGTGNKVRNGGYAVTVLDEVAPTIALTDVPVGEYAVGSTVALAKCTVLDDLSETEKVAVFTTLKDANGVVTTVTEESVTLTKAGKYTVFVWAVDEAGNAATVSYDIRVV